MSLPVKPIRTVQSLKGRVYQHLRDALAEMDIYSGEQAPRLDERKLAESLGVSRTPVREAISRLEQAGLVKHYPRRGTFVVRKSKAEILEIIYAWASIESMAARLATLRASDEELSGLREMLGPVADTDGRAPIDEYSRTNIRFHQAIVSLAKSPLLTDLADGLFVHMRAIRTRTIQDDDRAQRSVIDHARIIRAIEQRQTETAESLVRDHALRLAEHVERNVEYLE
ncbi:MAG: GntR family transcriptional regulator [Acidiferrobacteraceae bacterium]|jgi:DNA-binding GntR family transcriptional regulator|nr:GntR family transcriptional regulator [Acidiferrobacteraceae bacterium]MCP4827442.1 GntR family transcriptional regulator [Pseudomonadota bacterium]HJP07070.1 GntR family transcriptional regulator [Arenicellales bacterium]|tara:strand:- start:3951 stop:4631 length:681 start_codon:yes stop_codon:yes gene_type:complete